ncbi:serine hydrolase domain-containing protein [Acetobacter orleanensis]|uniref:Esterase n=1 Tax=Acetobacter orleanensis TaxID=104099 RepID=A0A4Y3TQ65_9PROT|nr:serine hydrolase domain-containing protein [Acetobacter orleanensis]KXV66738.1 beta-lactamase [Acetobacter orleanensis]PCD78779.1 serine hydrolase [Acetobacter orleanensis]GAN69766.1 beta-lactamase [Acetobacter orleanensis JCM 7639]GBR23429.1 beta-lactamase [Acetobacter orleanensis NRIC 0473]GEB83914.1 esterase [Acetobacter orleanensis]
MPTPLRLSRRMALKTGTLATGLSALGLNAAQAQTASTHRFDALDQIFKKAVQDGKTPGAVAAVGQAGQTLWKGVFGNRALVPHPEPMTWNTLFDMASLTKVLITAPAIMQLYERGLLTLDAPVSTYIPAFATNGKEAITIRLLLTHYSGLAPDLDLSTVWQGKEAAVQRVIDAHPINPPGERFVYSDINFITLGLIVEKLSGLPLNIYATRNILQPLSLSRTFFLPDQALQSSIAPTQYDEQNKMLRGVVHDPTTRRMGGVAGHAGLFSCAADMLTYAHALLARRAGHASPFPLRPETLVLMSTPQQPAGKSDLRGLGWDIATHYSSPRGDYFPANSFGHTGFTGTSLWLVPDNETFVLILTNRVHPDGKGNVVALRKDIATATALALHRP